MNKAVYSRRGNQKVAASHTAAAAGMQRNANFFIQHSFRKEKSAAQTVLMPLSPFIIALVGGQTKNARGQLSGTVHLFPLLQLSIAGHTDTRNTVVVIRAPLSGMS